MLSKIGSAVFRFFASYALACVVLVLLLVLTFLGTLEQTQSGIFDVQKKYFESLFLVTRVGGVVPIPLPGGGLLMTLLGINLVCGGILRIRKTRSRAGILIGHAGILLLLVGAFVKYAFSVDGHLTLFEGEGAGYFESYYNWEVAVRDASSSGEAREYVWPIGAREFGHHDRSIRLESTELPFDLTLTELSRNAMPRPQAPFAPWTAAAPTGSSILSFWSMNVATTTTSTPEIAPMSIAAQEETNAQGAVMATRPASMPFASQVGSGLPNFSLV